MPSPNSQTNSGRWVASASRPVLSFPMAVHAYSAMDSYLYGFSLQETTLPFRDADEAVAEAERGQSPPRAS